MSPRRSRGRAGALALGLAATGSLVAAGPCDIYASAGNPCVAAHATTRALYNNYNGGLYQVRRGSDNATTDVGPLSAGGVANAATQDNFCAGTTCLISVIYDQSGHNNHLTQGPAGAFTGPDVGGVDDLASATGAPVTLNGKKAYGVFFSPGTGYRNNQATGTATGDGPQGIYAVFDSTHYNSDCCFDYGNAETSSHDTGNGHMEAIYFGNNADYGSGPGNGPWVMADLENGLFAGEPGQNTADPTQTNRFVTSVVKGQPGEWSIRGAASSASQLETYYRGPRPSSSTVSGYIPMHREGAIILGIGGDNSNGGQGTFYEGVMTASYPTDSTENLVQQNIAAAQYAGTGLTSGPALNVGSSYSFQVTTGGLTNRYIAHTGATVNTQVVSSSSSTALKQQASWTVRTGLGNSACFSFESEDTPGSFIRHYNYALQLNANDGSKIFGEDATFCPIAGLDGQGNSFRSWSYPARYWRHYNALLYIASNGGIHEFDNTNLYNADTSFIAGASFA